MANKNEQFIKSLTATPNSGPLATPKVEPFKRQPLGYRKPDGTFVPTGKPAKD